MNKYKIQEYLDSNKGSHMSIAVAMECLNSKEDDIVMFFNKCKAACHLTYRLLEGQEINQQAIENNIGELRTRLRDSIYKPTEGVTESEFERDRNRWFCSLTMASIYLMIHKSDLLSATERANELYSEYKTIISNNQEAAVNILRALMLAHAYSVFNYNKNSDSFDKIREVYKYFNNNLHIEGCSFCLGDELIHCATIIKILAYLMPYTSGRFTGKVVDIITISGIEQNAIFKRAFKTMLKI